MSNSIGLACVFISLFVLVNPQNERFAKYKLVETYEIRPGILMMPSYSGDGQVCEIGIEKKNYSPEIIRLDASLSRKEIDDILDELVPANERGPKSNSILGRLAVIDGISSTETVDFENVFVQIVSSRLTTSHNRTATIENMVAVVKWKKRPCK